jgi:PPM family protein phosphatase
MKVRVGAFSDVGQARERNEDSYLSAPPLYAVADGMGGHRGGNVASSLAMRVLSEIAQPGRWDQLAEQVKEANRAILDQARDDRTLSGMGTTVTAAFMDNDELHLAHVGDSRGYLMRNGEFNQITEDHTLVHRMVQEGKITAAEAEHHPQRSILIRALGVEDPVEVDEFTVAVQDGDRILLCSDGLYSMVPDERTKEVLLSTRDPQEACKQLVQMANEAGGLDNITVVILDFEPGEGVDVLAPQSGLEVDTSDTRAMRIPTGVGTAQQAQPQAPPTVQQPTGAPPPAPVPPAAPRVPPAPATPAPPPATPQPTEPIPQAAPAPTAPPAQFQPAPEPKKRKRRWWFWTIAVVVLLALGFVGFRVFLDSRWFVGEHGGHVAVFRGLPIQLFGSLNLFGLVREFPGLSAKSAEHLAAFRDLRDGHTAESERSAFRIVDTIRRQVAEQRSGTRSA